VAKNRQGQILPKPKKGQFIDSDTVTKKQTKRIDNCALMLMNRHEHLFSNEVPNGKIIVREELKREDLDIPQIFDFKNLSYIIFRRDNLWCIRINQGPKMLIEIAYAKI